MVAALGLFFFSYNIPLGCKWHVVYVVFHLCKLSCTLVSHLFLAPAGGTGDITAVFEELCHYYPKTKFIGIGFSLGACILVRFLGEDVKRQKKFICAASICQGYDPSL